VLIDNNELSNSEAVNQIHLHEGCARVLVRHNRLINAPSGADYNAISIRARAYAVRVESNEIVNAGTGVAIYVDETCTGGGSIHSNRISGSSFADAIGVASTGWYIEDTSALTKQASTYGGLGMMTGMQSMSGWVKWNNQTVTLGTLPPYALVTRVTLSVADLPFDSDGTDLVSVGYDAGGEAYFAAATSVAAANTLATPAPGSAFHTHNYTGTPRTVKAYYNNGGSEPTQGEAFVCVEWCRVGRN
jgi:hypothetical protein